MYVYRSRQTVKDGRAMFFFFQFCRDGPKKIRIYQDKNSFYLCFNYFEFVMTELDKLFVCNEKFYLLYQSPMW